MPDHPWGLVCLFVQPHVSGAPTLPSAFLLPPSPTADLTLLLTHLTFPHVCTGRQLSSVGPQATWESRAPLLSGSLSVGLPCNLLWHLKLLNPTPSQKLPLLYLLSFSFCLLRNPVPSLPLFLSASPLFGPSMDQYRLHFLSLLKHLPTLNKNFSVLLPTEATASALAALVTHPLETVNCCMSTASVSPPAQLQPSRMPPLPPSLWQLLKLLTTGVTGPLTVTS